MRQKVTVERLKEFMEELAASARSPGKIYLTGGATALLLGFRDQTIDVDLKLDAEPEGFKPQINQLPVLSSTTSCGAASRWPAGLTRIKRALSRSSVRLTAPRYPIPD